MYLPARVIISNGPYMKREVSTCCAPSFTMTSLARWLAATFCIQNKARNFNSKYWQRSLEYINNKQQNDYIAVYKVIYI
jgi:hypothetical protein